MDDQPVEPDEPVEPVEPEEEEEAAGRPCDSEALPADPGEPLLRPAPGSPESQANARIAGSRIVEWRRACCKQSQVICVSSARNMRFMANRSFR